MKSLVEFIKESLNEARYKNMYDGPEFFDDENWELGYKYYNADTEFPTLEEVETAFAAKDMDDNPSFGGIELGVTFRKVDKDRWDVTSGDHHMLGRSFTNEKILDMIKDTKEKWFLMLRKEK